MRELELENDWPASIQLQVHAMGSQGAKNTHLEYIRFDFGSRFFTIGTVSYEPGSLGGWLAGWVLAGWEAGWVLAGWLVDK